jgi:hypothetical protein
MSREQDTVGDFRDAVIREQAETIRRQAATIAEQAGKLKELEEKRPVHPLMESQLVEDIYVDVSDSIASAHTDYWNSSRVHRLIADRW